MKHKRPKGITVLSIFLFVSSLISIKVILTPDAKMIMLNHLITGAAMKVYYVTIIGLGITIAIGLWFLKKWAALLFLFKNMFFVCFILVNVVMVQKETLLLADFKDYDGLLYGYRMMQAAGIVLPILMTVWLLAYRRHFATEITAIGLTLPGVTPAD